MNDLIDAYEDLCQRGIYEPIETWLERVSVSEQGKLFTEMLTLEVFYKNQQGKPNTPEFYHKRYPAYDLQIKKVFLDLENSSVAAANETKIFGKPENNPALTSPVPANVPPRKIGRFAIEKELGRGGFGVVYLATDEQLQRKVALKVPHPRLVQNPSDVEIYLKEARTVASLEHPNIVPVHEVGSEADYPIYIVSKFIIGSDLVKRMTKTPPTFQQATKWLIDLSDALRTAHKQGIVHRDIKPQNTLIDQNDRAYLVDFGLALGNDDVGKKLPAGGTPAYMSPEQISGQGHRVDGRSDIFSLGVLFYELLTGQRPFPGKSDLELYEQITEFDPKPMRQWNESVPHELERICLKMMSKRKSDRYPSAKDLVDDLQVFLVESESSVVVSKAMVISESKSAKSHDTTLVVQDHTPIALTPNPTSGSRPLRIVPKGLRSFDQRDADFFLELLPGPRDRDGLPDSVGFWKSRIEERNTDQTFAVGLVYGPSGCGKSSMMKAGLLPRLNSDIIAIYLEATPDDTERTLVASISKRLDIHELDTTPSISDLVNKIRRGAFLPRGKKLLIVMDQFEQWLYSHQTAMSEPLLESLMHCDGSRVQAIVMVRDDFWMAATRFFRDLDIRLVEGTNSAPVDLFDMGHARRVLRAFGLAFGKIDIQDREEHTDRKEFVSQAVEGLAENGKVISVRLSLFAEMMKGRNWTPESLREVGGTSGVGATFLEETFSASGAPPHHRYHQQAARAVLKALLPEGGTDIKGHMQSRDTLLEASGYKQRPSDFVDLIHLLDGELRLITPVDNLGPQAFDASMTPADQPVMRLASTAQVSYQLTHDYLVPSLRDWLTRKQRETRKGRAHLKLEERATSWNAKRENKQLPTLSEWLGVARYTHRKHWTEPQRTMMRRATRQHLSRVAVFLTLIIAIATSALVGKRYIDHQRETLLAQNEAEQNEASASSVVDSLARVESAKLADSLEKLVPIKKFAKDDLRVLYEKSHPDSIDRLHAALGLLGTSDGEPDKQIVQYVSERVLVLPPEAFLAVCDQLAKYKNEVVLTEYWSTVSDASKPAERRFRAAAALALFDPVDDKWFETQLTDFIANQMVDLNPIHLATWQQAFQSVSNRILPSLQTIFANKKSSETQKSLATSLIADYAKDDSKKLVETLIEAEPKSFAVLLPVLQAHGSVAVAELEKVLDRKLEPLWNDSPLDPNWKTPNALAYAAIELAHGIMEERFAYVQDMPLEKFLEVAEELRSSGYRPTRIRPHYESQSIVAATSPSTPTVSRLTPAAQFVSIRRTPQIQVAAVWTRDKKRWRIEANVIKSTLPSIDQPAEKDDLLIADIAPLPLSTKSDEPTFIVLWAEADTSDEKRWVLVDVNEETLRTTEATIREGKSARTISVRTDADRSRHYSVTWSSLGAASELFLRESGYDLPYKTQFEIAWGQPRRLTNPQDISDAEIAKFEALSDDQKKTPNAVNESLALAYYQTGSFDKALSILDQLIADQTSSETVDLYRVLSLARLRRTEDARQALAKFLETTTTKSFGAYANIQVAAFLGEWGNADELLTEAEKTYANDTEGFYNVVCAAAICSAANTDSIQSAVYATRTFDLLQQLLAVGYTNGGQLETDVDFASLHDDPKFMAIVAKLSPPQPFAAIRKADVTVESKLLQSQGKLEAVTVREFLKMGFRPFSLAISESQTLPAPTHPRDGSIVLHRPIIPDELQEILAVQQARVAVALLQMNATHRVWPLLRHQPDPRLRSTLLYYLTQYKVDPASILERLKLESETSSRRILILAIGDYAEVGLLSATQKQEMATDLLQRYSEDPDPGIHAACEWSLKQIGVGEQIQKIRSQFATGSAVGNRDWYLTKQGSHTMVIVQPVSSFLMGSPITETERYGGPTENYEARHRMVIDRQFAIASHEVTVAQYLAFQSNQGMNRVYSRELDAPANSITWYDAASYCNWLSEKEGIPQSEWCYDPGQPFSNGMKLASDYLHRTGYRLPTEAEWEYTCRAQSDKARSFGENDGLLTRYAWFAKNSETKYCLPVGSLRPNDFGMFDSYGNVMEWCQDAYRTYTYGLTQSKDIERKGIVSDTNARLLRGGSFNYQALYVRSSNRSSNRPDIRLSVFGFRPARTYR